MAYEQITVEPVAGALGAEVSGVDLSQPLDDPTIKEIQDAWMEHQVLFLRDQHITIEQHKAFGSRFGELHVHQILQPLADEGHPEIVVLESDKDRRFLAAAWHSDVTFEQEPPMGSILRAIEVPHAGGDTMWASMYAAHDALSDKMQAFLSGLEAVHDPGFFRQTAKAEARERFEKAPETVHPVIRTHPVTGKKAIFVNSAFTRRIKGMRPNESEALLRFLYDHLGQPHFTCRLRWRPGTIAMWDNRCTQHRVIPDAVDQYRLMHRVTLCGDRPF